MFGGYLHQDWLYEYGWQDDYHFDTDADKYPHFSLAIKAYLEDVNNSPELLMQAIVELQELVDKDYWEQYLEDYVFEKLDINVIPQTWGFTHQEFLFEVLRLLKNEANNIARRQFH